MFLNPFPQFIMFDLDNTLAVSKQPIDAEMASILANLMRRTRVGIISGGGLEQLEKQVAAQLPPHADMQRLYLQPTSGAALYTFDGMWKKKYEESLSDDEVRRIEDAIETAVQETGVVDTATPSYGERTESRGAEVVFSALGQQAPWEKKKLWDPEMKKRHLLQDALIHLLPGFEVKIGGSTSIDVTKRGVNKAFGVRKISELFDIAIGDMLYVGDQLSNGGNDEVVKETGIATHAVSGPDETKQFITNLLA